MPDRRRLLQGFLGTAVLAAAHGAGPAGSRNRGGAWAFDAGSRFRRVADLRAAARAHRKRRG